MLQKLLREVVMRIPVVPEAGPCTGKADRGSGVWGPLRGRKCRRRRQLDVLQEMLIVL